jgi:hypothetical protein
MPLAARKGRGVGKNVYLEDLEQIDKSPSKCVQTRDPQTRGQSPKRGGGGGPSAYTPPTLQQRAQKNLFPAGVNCASTQPPTPSRSWHGWRWCNTFRPKKRIKAIPPSWPLALSSCPDLPNAQSVIWPQNCHCIYRPIGHQYWPWGAWVRSHTTKTHQVMGAYVRC